MNGRIAARARRSVLITLVSFIALAGMTGCGGEPGITVSVAASLTDSMALIAEEFESQSGTPISLNIGGSLSLTRQIELGAPVDVVVLVGDEATSRLEAAGLVHLSAAVRILGNQIVVVARSGDIAYLDSLDDLASSFDGRIAMADPALAPAGTYAEEALRQVGIYDELKSRLVPTLDVRSAADAVASGAAEFGIIYRTDATAFGGLSVVYEIPGTLHEPISYFAAPISSSDNASDAEAFMEFLGTPWVGDVFESNGFTFIPAR